MRKIIALGGEPAVGKSTIVSYFIASDAYGWEKKKEVKLVDTLYNEKLDTYVLGIYGSEGGDFPGTDRYSMAVQPQAIEFVKNTKSNIVFEGDRLFNQSFLEFLADLPDTELEIFIIKANKERIEENHKIRKDSQSDTFLKGRHTKIENLRSNFVLMPYMTVYENNEKEDIVRIGNTIRDKLIS